MEIKETKLLRRRADWHCQQDHIKQGTYGQGSTNGKPVFEGCAVGCLSTPHTIKGLNAWLREHLFTERDPGEIVDVDIDDQEMREALADEFGICYELTVLAEEIFEAQKFHGAAINFIRDFAHALQEGSDIADKDCEWFETEHKIGSGRASYIDLTEPFLSWLKEGAPVPALA